MFLMPGLVSPALPKAFAVPTAYGDLTAAILALLALGCIRYENAAAVPMLWLFNIAGLLDLIYANISTFKDHVDPVYLGCLLLLGGAQRAGHGGRARLDLRLLSEADRLRLCRCRTPEISERSANCVP